MTIQTIPLSQLRLSPQNSRKHRSRDNVVTLAESLKIHGQLQNLVVTVSDQDGVYAVDAGGTRLLALQMLHERGDIAADHPVDCKVITDIDSLEASTAENVIREEMHPADQFRAFKAMADARKSTAEVAAHFSVAESVVIQRLKLANVRPDLFALYESGDMKLDQLQALALTDDHEAQRLAWFGTKGAKIEHSWQRSAHNIRQRITAKEVDPRNPLALFVGADAYEAAGGQVRRDMFSTDVYFSDAKLLERLAGEKLEALAETERAAGWSWVETHLQLDYSGQARYGTSSFGPKRRSLTPEEQTRLAQIQKRLDTISEAIEEDEGSDDFDALDREQDALIAERDELDARRETWPDVAKAKTGVIIYLHQGQGLQIQRARLRPGQRDVGGKVTGGKDGKPKKPELSRDMVVRLEKQRTAAIREHIAAQPAAALTLLLADLIGRLRDSRASDDYLAITATNHHRGDAGADYGKAVELAKAPARIALDRRVARWLKSGMPAKNAELAAWLEKLSGDQRLELLALLVALTVPVSTHDGKELATRFNVDMTAWWQPTAETYFSLVPKALLAEAVTDVAGKEAGEALLVLKKDGAMAETAKRLNGAGWLPKPLRGPGYKLAKAGAAAQGAKKAPANASKAPATKPAVKPKKAAKKATRPAGKKGGKQ